MIGLSGAFGATMALSLISDLLAFTTIHIYWFYMVAARIFHWQLTILYSLFNLFRGKKRNTLRHRIDSCDYDLDQLLLGTILFTLLTFLFPTIVVYYLTFALVSQHSSYSLHSAEQYLVRCQLNRKTCFLVTEIEPSGGYMHAGDNGNGPGVSQPFSSVCHNASTKGSGSPTGWFET